MIKTESSFRRNLERIAELADKRRDPLVVATFAMYRAKGYTLARFLAQELDHAPGGFPIEIWGRPPATSSGR